MIVRRVAGAVVIALAAAVGALPLVYWLQFAGLPPTRLNLLFWIPPDGAECERRGRYAERAGLLGTDVTVGDMCAGSEYGPGTSNPLFAGPYLWLAIVIGCLLLVLRLLLKRRYPGTRGAETYAPEP